MQKSFLEVCDVRDYDRDEFYRMIGYAFELISCSPQQARPATVIRTILEPAIALNFIKFYFNADGMVVGFVAWGFLTEEVEERLIDSGTLDLHISDWNEGTSLWILDFIARPGHAKYILRDLRDNLFRTEERIRYFRLQPARVVCREVSRSSCVSFFRQSPSSSRTQALAETQRSPAR
jgi:cytolysin-activating lysine-acyltransferase